MSATRRGSTPPPGGGSASLLIRRMRRALFLIAAFAGLLGVAGVGAAAAAAHLGGGQLLDTAATFLMIHSTAVLAIVGLAQRVSPAGTWLFLLAALLLVAGMLLFCGDFDMRALAARPLFRMAAPSGGTLLMAGWIAAAIGAAMAATARDGLHKLDNKRRTCVVFRNSQGGQASEKPGE